MVLSRLFLCIVSLFLLKTLAAADHEVEIVYLSWRSDPTTTMVVVWHDTESSSGVLSYKQADQLELWRSIDATKSSLGVSNIAVYFVEMTGLEPDTMYQFRINSGKTRLCQTLPSQIENPLKVIVAGDAFLDEKLYRTMNHQVSQQDPAFVVLGGDLAYTEGLRRAFKSKEWKGARWQQFLQIWSQMMVAPSGRMIPMVPVIGNHDVREGFDDPEKETVFFYAVFPFLDNHVAYRTMDIGQEVSLYLLDSGHTSSIAGAQKGWLREALWARRGRDYQFPMYHVSAYPTQTRYHHRASIAIRAHWVPLFEQSGIRVVFENDSHTFKKTFPLKEGKIASDGIVYLGDGCYGVPPLSIRKHWYVEKGLSRNHYWELLFSKQGCQIQAVDIEGALLDAFMIPSSRQEDLAKENTTHR